MAGDGSLGATRGLAPVCVLLLVTVTLPIPPVAADSAQFLYAPVHAPPVLDVTIAPYPAKRMEDLSVTVTLSDGANVSGVRLVFCRAESYACGLPVVMHPDVPGGAVFHGMVAWAAGFFRGVVTVGLNLTVMFEDGSAAFSPRATSGEPRELEALRARGTPGGLYYFYRLPAERMDDSMVAEETAMALSFGLVLLVLVAVLASQRFRRRAEPPPPRTRSVRPRT